MDGLLMAVHMLPDVAITRECPGRALRERLPLCPTHRNHRKALQQCNIEDVPTLEERRRQAAAEYLLRPAPGRVRGLYTAALLQPQYSPWPDCPPPYACPELDRWAQAR